MSLEDRYEVWLCDECKWFTFNPNAARAHEAVRGHQVLATHWPPTEEGEP